MNLKRFIELYISNVKAEFSTIMTYRLAFLLNSLSLIFGALIGPITALLIYEVSPGFTGWTLSEMLVFLGTLQVTFGITHLLVLGFSWVTAELLINGTFDTILLKPVNTIGYMLGRVIDFDGIIQAGAGLVIVIIGLNGMNYSPSLSSIILYLILVIDGALLWFALNVIVGGLCFKHARVDDWLNIAFNVSRIGDYPLNLYGGLASFIFTFILPFGLTSYYPSQYLIGRLTDSLLVLTLTGIMVIMISLSIIFYNKSIKHYSSAGG